MATADALERQKAAPGGAVDLQRFQRVVRAARVKAATRRHHRADRQLIKTQQEAENGFHGAICGDGAGKGKAAGTGAGWRGCDLAALAWANMRDSSTRKAAFSLAVVAGPSLL